MPDAPEEDDIVPGEVDSVDDLAAVGDELGRSLRVVDVAVTNRPVVTGH
jgi:hypothetical protein